MRQSPIHCNKHLICSIDTETTGLDNRIHDVWQLAIIPLDTNYKPSESHLPLEMIIKPGRLENYDRENKFLNHKGIVNACINGFDADKAVDLILKWFEELKMPPNKKIMPLGQNYCFDKGFLVSLMGTATYDFMFDYHFRDTMAVANYLNDRADLSSEPYPFPKVNLTYLCSQLGIENLKPHDALNDAIKTAEVYRKMMAKM